MNFHWSKAPILLVGTKSDLREDPAELERLKEKGLTFVNEESVIKILIVINKPDIQSNNFSFFQHSIFLSFIFQVRKMIRDKRRRGVVVKYIECSALLQTNVKNVFDEAVKLAMYGEEKPRKTCTIF